MVLEVRIFQSKNNVSNENIFNLVTYNKFNNQSSLHKIYSYFIKKKIFTQINSYRLVNL